MRSILIITSLILSFVILPQTYAASSTTSTTLVEVTPSPSPVESPSKVEATLKKIDDAIPGDIAVWLLTALALLAELLMRMFPTLKPKSLLLLVAKIFTSVGSIFTKISSLLDKIAQNIKEPKKEEPKP